MDTQGERRKEFVCVFFFVLHVSPAGGAHLDLCTEAIALLFQGIHFSFLSCHGGGRSGVLLTENEAVTLKREKDKLSVNHRHGDRFWFGCRDTAGRHPDPGGRYKIH